jgi:hypothetical protein
MITYLSLVRALSLVLLRQQQPPQAFRLPKKAGLNPQVVNTI